MALKKIMVLAILSVGIIITLLDMAVSTSYSETSEMNKQGNIKIATVAGGCFWCIESDFEKLDAVISVVSGYTGSKFENPTYHLVSSGATGHIEAIQIQYDSHKISYEEILKYFYQHIDPIDSEGQFCDRGSQYVSAVFYANEEEKKIAEEVKNWASKTLNAKIKTLQKEASKFYRAEDYHQDYYKKSLVRYKYYRFSCGRDKRVKSLWNK